MSFFALALSTGDDIAPARANPDDLVRVAIQSSATTEAIVALALGIQQGISETTSGSISKKNLLTALAGGGIVTSGVVTDIGQLLYNVNKQHDPIPLRIDGPPAPRFLDSKKAVDPQARKLPTVLFKLLQAWEGVVVAVREDDFVARIRDKTNKENPDEEVTLLKEEIAPSEQDQIVVGAVFYWSIGYKDAPGEPRRRTSQIRFRRLPAWTSSEQEVATKYEDTLRRAFLGSK